MSCSYRQLLLFDCDAGRSSLFNNLEIVNQIPLNCQCYLFWNNNDPQITLNLNRLSQIEQRIHLCPSTLRNSKNSADAKLIYFLGKFVNDFPFILIVHGNDQIYSEVISTVKSEFNSQKIEEKQINESPHSQMLQQIIEQCQQRNRKWNCVDSTQIQRLVINKNKCFQCTKEFKQYLSLYDHIKSKHKSVSCSLICKCNLKFANRQDYSRHKKTEAKRTRKAIQCSRMNSFPNLFIKSDSLPLLLSADKNNKCPFNGCQRLYKSDGFIAHLQSKHKNDIHIQIQCCDSAIKRTLQEFYEHIQSQHNIVDVEIVVT